MTNDTRPPPAIQAVYDRIQAAGYRVTGPGHWRGGGTCSCCVNVLVNGVYVPLYGHGATWGDVAAMMLRDWGAR